MAAFFIPYIVFPFTVHPAGTQEKIQVNGPSI